MISRDGGRGVAPQAILDALKNPSKIVQQADGALKYIGEKATIVLSEVGRIITGYGTPRGPIP
jgi:hypothetical protein